MAAPGWKVTPTEQPPNAAAGEKQKLETAKSVLFVPVEVAEVTVRARAVLFVMVKNWVPLVAPRARAPKSKLAGETLTPPTTA